MSDNVDNCLQPHIIRSSESDLSLDWGADNVTDQGSNVVELLREIKGETDNMDDDLQNLDPAFLHGMNLNSLVREFEMEASGGGSDLGILALADDCLN